MDAGVKDLKNNWLQEGTSYGEPDDSIVARDGNRVVGSLCALVRTGPQL